MQSYLDSITDAVLTDYITYNATEEELRSMGWIHRNDNFAELHFGRRRWRELFDAFVLNISRAPDEKTAAEAG